MLVTKIIPSIQADTDRRFRALQPKHIKLSSSRSMQYKQIRQSNYTSSNLNTDVPNSRGHFTFEWKRVYKSLSRDNKRQTKPKPYEDEITLLRYYQILAECPGGKGHSARDAEGSRLRQQHTPARGWRDQQSPGHHRREQQRGRPSRLRGLRQGDSRAMVPKGRGSCMALRLPALLPLPSPLGRRVDVLRQGRQHLLQRGLL